MAKSGEQIIYPSLEMIIDNNRRIIHLTGGFFLPPSNLANPNSLLYILDAIQKPLYGRQLFPAIEMKAAALGYEIIKSHVFNDGNKRTGIHTALEFLFHNEIILRFDPKIEEMALAIANGDKTRDDLFEWFVNHRIDQGN